jgi:hypothetical protein
MLGDYVAELQLTGDEPIRAKRTTRESGHHTLWGDPVALLHCIVSVHRVASLINQESEK